MLLVVLGRKLIALLLEVFRRVLVPLLLVVLGWIVLVNSLPILPLAPVALLVVLLLLVLFALLVGLGLLLAAVSIVVVRRSLRMLRMLRMQLRGVLRRVDLLIGLIRDFDLDLLGLRSLLNFSLYRGRMIWLGIILLRMILDVLPLPSLHLLLGVGMDWVRMVNSIRRLVVVILLWL
jgi:hypothetical protein